MREIFPDYCDIRSNLFLWALFHVSLLQRYSYWNLSPKNYYPPRSYKFQFLAIFYKIWLSLEKFYVITWEECARTRSEKHQKQNGYSARCSFFKNWEKNLTYRSARKDVKSSKSKTLPNDCLAQHREKRRQMHQGRATASSASSSCNILHQIKKK